MHDAWVISPERTCSTAHVGETARQTDSIDATKPYQKLIDQQNFTIGVLAKQLECAAMPWHFPCTWPANLTSGSIPPDVPPSVDRAVGLAEMDKKLQEMQKQFDKVAKRIALMEADFKKLGNSLGPCVEQSLSKRLPSWVADFSEDRLADSVLQNLSPLMCDKISKSVQDLVPKPHTHIADSCC